MKKSEYKCNVSQFLGKRKITVNSEIPLIACSKIVKKNFDKDSLDSSQNETPQAADDPKVIEFHEETNPKVEDSTRTQFKSSIPPQDIDLKGDDLPLDTNAADPAQTQSNCSIPSADINSEIDDFPFDTNAVDSTQLQSSCSTPSVDVDLERNDLPFDTNAADSAQTKSKCSSPSADIDSERDDLPFDTNAADSAQTMSRCSTPSADIDSERDDLPLDITEDSAHTQSKCSTPSTDIDSESDDFPLSIYKGKPDSHLEIKSEITENFPTNIVKIEKREVELEAIKVESGLLNDSAVVDLTMDEGREENEAARTSLELWEVSDDSDECRQIFDLAAIKVESGLFNDSAVVNLTMDDGQEEKNEAAGTSLEHLDDPDDSDEFFDEIDPDAAEHSKFFENSNKIDADLDGVTNDLNFINTNLMEQLLPKDLPTQNEILEGLKNMGPRWNENAQAFYKQKRDTKEALDNVFVLLKECPDENDYAEDPDGLDVELMRHQKRALKWMTWREKKRPFGGILADDMGLGKTLSVIALVLQEKNTLENDSEECENDWNLTEGGTLVICPTSLLRQWEKEILKKTKCATLMPLVFYGNNHPKDIERLSTFDIVITTYRTVCGQRGKHLFNLKWRRIVVDEAHIIRNANTQTSEFICSLNAKHRWALTGTPIHNKETDIYALLKFLRYRPFDDKSCWSVWLRDRKRLSVVVRSSMLRRTKADLLAENAVFKLPPRREELIEIDLSEEELLVHHTVLSFSKTLFEKFLAQRNAERYGMDSIALAAARDEKFFTSKEYEEFLLRLQGPTDDRRIGSYVILVLLLRLRQICCHPGLAKAILYDEDDTETSDLDTSEDSQNNEPFTKDNCHVKEEAVRIKKETTNVEEEAVRIKKETANVEEEAVRIKKETANVEEETAGVKKELPDVKHENVDIKEEQRDIQQENKKPKKLPSVRKILNCHNPVYDFANPSTKIKRLLEVLDERVLRKREKAIIVSSWSKFLEIMGSHLEIAGVRTLHFNGGMSVEDRLQVLENFHDNQKESKVLLLTLTAGGVGLNLVAANHLFLMEPHWNPQMEAQAQDRIYRMGQERNVYIYKFICQNSIEERIKAIQESKLEMAKTILTGAAAISGGRLTLQDLMKLFGVVDFRMKKNSKA